MLEADPTTEAPVYGPSYDTAMRRTMQRGAPKTTRREYDWTRETRNFQVFEERRSVEWNGVLYLPNDILRVGRPFGRIEVITGIRKKHHCNCPDCAHNH